MEWSVLSSVHQIGRSYRSVSSGRAQSCLCRLVVSVMAQIHQKSADCITCQYNSVPVQMTGRTKAERRTVTTVNLSELGSI